MSNKGFLPGPYDHRTALDEVVQMMGGLAYMTGRPGDPLRAGTSVNDIMGGMFAAIATLGALIQRGVTGRGMEVQSALFENNVFLMGQHMLQFAVTGRHPAPMPARDNPWAIYDVFTVADGEQIFLAAVSDAQWLVFCDVLGLPDLKADPAYATNNQRVVLRPQLLALLRERLAHAEGRRARRDDGARGAAVRADQEAGGSLRRPASCAPPADSPTCACPMATRRGETVKTTLLPFTMAGSRLGVRLDPPRLGEHTRALLSSLGLTADDIDALYRQRAVA